MLNAAALEPVISTLSMVMSVLPGLVMVTVASAALPDRFTVEGSAVIPRGLAFEPELSVGTGLAVSPVPPPAVGVVPGELVELEEEVWEALLWVCFPPTPSMMG